MPLYNLFFSRFNSVRAIRGPLNQASRRLLPNACLIDFMFLGLLTFNKNESKLAIAEKRRSGDSDIFGVECNGANIASQK